MVEECLVYVLVCGIIIYVDEDIEEVWQKYD